MCGNKLKIFALCTFYWVARISIRSQKIIHSTEKYQLDRCEWCKDN